MTIERQARIELLLAEEFEPEGHKVEKVDGAFVAKVYLPLAERPYDYQEIDLTRIAEAINGRSL